MSVILFSYIVLIHRETDTYMYMDSHSITFLSVSSPHRTCTVSKVNCLFMHVPGSKRMSSSLPSQLVGLVSSH